MNFPAALMRFLMGARLPSIRGEVALKGLTEEVRIRRDVHGVPYIEAAHETDAWFGLGFCHGQDRAFQLETILRLVRGTLAELFGERLLPTDRLSRRIGFYRSGAGHVSVMPENQLVILRAYAAGINAAYQKGARRPAHEFSLLRARPTPWTEVDLLGYMNYMAMNLSVWTAKLTRLFVLRHDGPAALIALDPEYPDWLPVTDPAATPAGPFLERLAADVETLIDILGAGASNNWALSGSRTATGRPLLANDPHLAPRLPAPWYLAHVRYPELTVCGASFAGLPLIASGFNGTAAWGVTAGLVDGVDLFSEDFNPADRTIRTGNERQACTAIPERYIVKGRREPFEEDVLLTPRGPIVSDLMEGLQEVLSMKATWMLPRPVDGITNFHKASNFQNCRANFEHLYLTSLNVAYADTSGTIGWQIIGEAPRRTRGYGSLPMPAWEPGFDWGDRLVPVEEMPWSMDPETGFIATANNQPRRDGDGPYLGRDFFPYRQARIVEMLSERRDWDLEKTRRMQLDQDALPWREMRAAVLAAAPEAAGAKQAREILAAWDGVLAADSAGAAVYEYLVVAIAHRLAESKAPNSVRRVLGQGFSGMFAVSGFFIRHVSLVAQLLREQPAGWFDDGWESMLCGALATAHEKLAAALGPDASRWRWGDVHPLHLTHPLGQVKGLAGIFNRGPFPTGGDHDSVNSAGRRVGSFGSSVTGLANLRMAVDVGAWEQNYFVLAGGQSGNPCSPNYDDQLKRWLRGETIDLAWSEEAIRERTVATLVLRSETA